MADPENQVNSGKARKFWAAYQACVELYHIPPQRSGYYVRWVQEFVDFQPETKLRDRSIAVKCSTNEHESSRMYSCSFV